MNALKDAKGSSGAFFGEPSSVMRTRENVWEDTCSTASCLIISQNDKIEKSNSKPHDFGFKPAR